MRDEVAALPELIEAAALVGYAGQWVRLSMRKTALEADIRELELDPHRRAVERLERELESLEAARVEALSAEPPPVPDHLRHTLTPEMLKRRLVEGALRRSSGASRELAEARRKLEDAEEGAARVVVV
jgi:hypothetical protein